MSFCWKWCGESSMPSDQEIASGTLGWLSATALMVFLGFGDGDARGREPDHRFAEAGQLDAPLAVGRQVVGEADHRDRLLAAVGQRHPIDDRGRGQLQRHYIRTAAQAVEQG